MENKELESIWADGVPQKINQEDLLKPIDILKLCLNLLIDKVLDRTKGKILGVNPATNSFPNIYYEHNKKVYAIAIIPNVFPHYATINDELRIRFVNDCYEQKLIPIMSVVLVSSTDKERANKQVLLKGDLYRVNHVGMIELNNEEKQIITPKDLNFKFL